MQDKTVKQSASLNQPESLANTEMLIPEIEAILEKYHNYRLTTQGIDFKNFAAHDIYNLCHSIMAKTERQKAFREVAKWLDKWRIQDENINSDLLDAIENLKSGKSPSED
jgi:hypothetical protein